MRTRKQIGLLAALLSCAALSAACGADRDGNRGAGDNAAGGRDTNGRGGSAADPNQPAAPNVPPTFAPKFPGAGTSGADKPLTNGELCDYVPVGGAPTPNEITRCFFGPDDPVPAATLEQVLECVNGKDVVHVRLTFNPGFVDNTYGSGSIGWPQRRGHTFKDLERSDHAELVFTDRQGNVVLQFKMDYLSADPSAPSGYGTLGVTGGEGKVIVGDASWVLDTSTSLHRNLNERGYESYTTDSPSTDADYTPNPDAPAWDYRVVYEAWVDVRAFGDAGFGGAKIEHVHASPAKTPKDTIEVEEDECPPEFCEYDDCDEPPPPDDECVPGPDAYCEDSKWPPQEEPDFCEAHPTAPECVVG